MRRYVILIGVFLVLAWIDGDAFAQKTTEIFIPAGKSPGLSGKHTLQGDIESLDSQKREVTIADSTGSHTLTIPEEAHIWVDRSQMKETNTAGTFSDLKTGLLAEVKFIDNEREKGVEWIKVQMKSESPQ